MSADHARSRHDNNVDAAATGSHLDALIHARDDLASSLDSCTDAYAQVQLVAQYRGVLAEIAAISKDKGSNDDNARTATSAGPESAKARFAARVSAANVAGSSA